MSKIRDEGPSVQSATDSEIGQRLRLACDGDDDLAELLTLFAEIVWAIRRGDRRRARGWRAALAEVGYRVRWGARGGRS